MEFSSHTLTVAIFTVLISTVEVFANQQSRIVLKNGGPTALSPGVIYVTSTHQPLAEVGARPTAGFVGLCQHGRTAPRIAEINQHENKVMVLPATSAIMPGASLEVTLPMELTANQAVHYESMYVDTKDVCSVVTVTGEQIMAMTAGSQKDFHNEEKVLLSGAFKDPVVTMNTRCDQAAKSIDCLRMLTAENPAPKIRYFPGYLPSVLHFLESKYGAAGTQPLLLPTQGTLNFIVHK